MDQLKMSEVTDFVIRSLDELPDNKIIYKTVVAKYTKQQLIAEIEKRSDVGLIYCTEVFRVARDLITRKKEPSTLH